jgi:TPR repeat protein
MRLYRLAAAQGLVDAQYNLGYMFMNGLGVAQDSFEAVQWFSLAAAQGDVDSQNVLKIITKS